MTLNTCCGVDFRSDVRITNVSDLIGGGTFYTWKKLQKNNLVLVYINIHAKKYSPQCEIYVKNGVQTYRMTVLEIDY